LITYEELKEIKKLAVIALCSDDFLMNTLVLKGGSCIELAYRLSARASKDIDYSIDYSFTNKTLKEVLFIIKVCFENTFIPQGYYPFDIDIKDCPSYVEEFNKMSGYVLTFKLTTKENQEKYIDNIELLRKTALPIGKKSSKAFKIEISKHEFCDLKELKEIDGHTVFVYSPALVIFEKLRALCQAMKEYRILHKIEANDKPRSRDFYDIWLVNENLAHLDFRDNNNRQILKQVFEAKDVSLDLLDKVRDKFHVHVKDFETVLQTEIFQKGVVQNFTYYFDYVLQIIDELEIFRIK